MNYNREIGRVRRKLNDLALDLFVAMAEQRPAEDIEAIKYEIKELRQIREQLYKDRPPRRSQNEAS